MNRLAGIIVAAVGLVVAVDVLVEDAARAVKRVHLEREVDEVVVACPPHGGDRVAGGPLRIARVETGAIVGSLEGTGP